MVDRFSAAPDRGTERTRRDARRYAQGTNGVVLDPDVAAVFPDAAAVNRALRKLAGLPQLASPSLSDRHGEMERTNRGDVAQSAQDARPGCPLRYTFPVGWPAP